MATQFNRPLLLGALTLCLASALQAAPAPQFDAAVAQFLQARGGDEAAIGQADATFAALLKAEPTNPVLLAYTGALTALRATTTWLPWKKIRHAEDGLALLDKALTLLTPAHNAALQRGVPAALEVRLVAANTFLALPGFMNRHARGVKLLDELLASAQLGAAPLQFKGEVWLAAARLATQEQRWDDARKYLGEVVNASAPQAELARSQLKALAS